MSDNFKPQNGFKLFESSDSSTYSLIEHLKLKRYTLASIIIKQNTTILDIPNSFGWTPFMMVLTNIKNNNDVVFIKKFIKYVNLDRINIDDMNYILIIIKYCEPELISDVFNILNDSGVNIHYESTSGLNALDLSIKMFIFAKGNDNDMYYYQLAYKLKHQYNMKSNQYDIINYIEGKLTTWILDNLDSDNESYQVMQNNIKLPGSILAPVFNTDNVILEYIPVKPQYNKEEMEVLDMMTSTELEYALTEILKTKTEETKIKNPVKNNTKKKKQKIIQITEGDDITNVKSVSVIKFGRQNDIIPVPKCSGCKIGFDKREFCIIKPCNHSVLCTYCIKAYNSTLYTRCPLCGIFIDYVIFKGE